MRISIVDLGSPLTSADYSISARPCDKALDSMSESKSANADGEAIIPQYLVRTAACSEPNS